MDKLDEVVRQYCKWNKRKQRWFIDKQRCPTIRPCDICQEQTNRVEWTRRRIITRWGDSVWQTHCKVCGYMEKK